ncbi:hypothetical protein KSP40_PGU019377 [Platanthera guangdongensis]|uniref:Uncharacterized protein n=1 Tax=Platanthera guangdongensis TaxID=2320717 RepID=A0ABR2MPM4_9ASPA
MGNARVNPSVFLLLAIALLLLLLPSSAEGLGSVKDGSDQEIVGLSNYMMMHSTTERSASARPRRSSPRFSTRKLESLGSVGKMLHFASGAVEKGSECHRNGRLEVGARFGDGAISPFRMLKTCSTVQTET